MTTHRPWLGGGIGAGDQWSSLEMFQYLWR